MAIHLRIARMCRLKIITDKASNFKGFRKFFENFYASPYMVDINPHRPPPLVLTWLSRRATMAGKGGRSNGYFHLDGWQQLIYPIDRKETAMNIPYNIIKHYLKNVYFINGTSYAGKSTMVHLLAQRYDMIECGENYHARVSDHVATPEIQPAISYFSTMSGWEEFLSRTPEEYAQWIKDVSREAAAFEIAELIRLSAEGKPIIVDTNIPVDVLRQIARPDHVAIMLSPQSMSVERFFDRSDPEKQFLLHKLEQMPDPEAAMANFRACLEKISSPENYAAMANSGFFTLERRNDGRDTREEVLQALARHFGLVTVERLTPDSPRWQQAIDLAQHCSWEAGPHFAQLLRENRFADWETAFAACAGDEVVGFCSFLKEDYYPDHRYWPWISSLFVTEAWRGRRVSRQLIRAAEEYAQAAGFDTVYIPSDMEGFYEKCGYVPCDRLVNYGGDTDTIFRKDLTGRPI